MISLGFTLLRYDKAKYFALVLAVALASFLTQNQASILAAFLGLAGSQIRDVREADFWVMDKDTECFDQSKQLKEGVLQVVRGVPGVAWAAPFLKVDTSVRTQDGKLSTVSLLGLDEATRVAEPIMAAGDPLELYQRNTVAVDKGGWQLLFPDKPFAPGQLLQVGENWLRISGLTEASPPFTGFPILFTSRTTALSVRPEETRSTTFVVGRLKDASKAEEVLSQIRQRAQVKAMTRDAFSKASSDFYAAQGVPALFYITIAIGFIVGAAFTAQTFLMYVKENAKGLAVFKVLGVTVGQLATMMTAQALFIAFLGTAIGTALAVGMTAAARQIPFLRGLYVPWEVAIGFSAVLTLITLISAGIAFVKVMRVAPADVFRAAA